MNQPPPLHPELEALLALGREAEYNKGEVLLRPEDNPDHVFYLQEGLVKAYVSGNNGEERIHALFRAGDFFPMVLVVAGIRLNVYFAAVTHCRMVTVPASRFLGLLQSNAAACYDVLQLMANQYATYIARVDNLEYKFARERLAYRLLLLARKIGVANGASIILPHLSQYEIGSTINLSRESVSRELSRFERLGYIGPHSRGIEIKDKAALQRELGAQNSMLYSDE